MNVRCPWIKSECGSQLTVVVKPVSFRRECSWKAAEQLEMTSNNGANSRANILLPIRDFHKNIVAFSLLLASHPTIFGKFSPAEKLCFWDQVTGRAQVGVHDGPAFDVNLM
jgi:hypothetical protein